MARLARLPGERRGCLGGRRSDRGGPGDAPGDAVGPRALPAFARRRDPSRSRPSARRPGRGGDLDASPAFSTPRRRRDADGVLRGLHPAQATAGPWGRDRPRIPRVPGRPRAMAPAIRRNRMMRGVPGRQPVRETELPGPARLPAPVGWRTSARCAPSLRRGWTGSSCGAHGTDAVESDDAASGCKPAAPNAARHRGTGSTAVTGAASRLGLKSRRPPSRATRARSARTLRALRAPRPTGGVAPEGGRDGREPTETPFSERPRSRRRGPGSTVPPPAMWQRPGRPVRRGPACDLASGADGRLCSPRRPRALGPSGRWSRRAPGHTLSPCPIPDSSTCACTPSIPCSKGPTA